MHITREASSMQEYNTLGDYMGKLVRREGFLCWSLKGCRHRNTGHPSVEIKTRREKDRGGFQRDWYTRFVRSDYKEP